MRKVDSSYISCSVIAENVLKNIKIMKNIFKNTVCMSNICRSVIWVPPILPPAKFGYAYCSWLA